MRRMLGLSTIDIKILLLGHDIAFCGVQVARGGLLIAGQLQGCERLPTVEDLPGNVGQQEEENDAHGELQLKEFAQTMHF